MRASLESAARHTAFTERLSGEVYHKTLQKTLLLQQEVPKCTVWLNMFLNEGIL